MARAKKYHVNAVNNSCLIVEVLSRSTEEYDRNDKFEHDKGLASLQTYVLVSHRERSVEVWTKCDAGWECHRSVDGDIASLKSIGATLDVRELYDAAAQSTA